MTTEEHDVRMLGLPGIIFGLVVLGSTFYTVAFATNNWSVVGYSKEGLWQQCSCTAPSAASLSWFQGAQAMLTIGLIGILVAFFFIFLYMFIDGTKGKAILILLIAGLIFLSVIFMIIGWSLYGAHRTGLGASFGLSITGAILLLAGAVMAVLQIIKHSR